MSNPKRELKKERRRRRLALDRAAEYGTGLLRGGGHGLPGREGDYPELASIARTQPTLPPGRYRIEAGEFKRIGDAEPFTAWHGGEASPEGGVKKKLWPSGYAGEGEGAAQMMPVIYASPMPGVPSSYARPYLYELEVTPQVVVEINEDYKGEDNTPGVDAYAAVARGADVLDVHWGDGAHVISLLDQDHVAVEAVYPEGDQYVDWKELTDDTIDDLIRKGVVDKPVYKRDTHSPMEPIADDHSRYVEGDQNTTDQQRTIALEEAINQYKSAESIERLPAALRASMVYRGMPNQPAHHPRSGRGKMRY